MGTVELVVAMVTGVLTASAVCAVAVYVAVQWIRRRGAGRHD